MGKSANPANPDAHPTAPGGMSQKALAEELMSKHGWSKADVRKWRENKQWLPGSWPEMIQAVVQERLNREAEARAEQPEQPEHNESTVTWPEPVAPVVAPEQSTDPGPLLVPFEGVLDYEFAGHRGAGPSGAERWMTCTASLGASRAFLETLTPNQQREFSRANESARQGTTAHAAAEAEALLHLGRIDQAELDATLLELAVEPDTAGASYDEEMAEYITEYVDLIRQYASERGKSNILIESSVSAVIPLTGMQEGEFYEIKGSADAIALPTEDDRTLVVVDLKYGNGIDVDVDSNPQVRIYGLGALDLLTDDEGSLITPVDNVVYYIVQPRLGGIKTWTESLDDLLDWRDETLAPALTAALYGSDEGAKFVPSEKACQWCPARGTCDALAEQRMADAADLFDTQVEAEYQDGPGAFPETGSLSDERLGALLAQALGIAKITADLKAEAQRRLHRGDQVPGFQLVSYSPPRKWNEDAADALRRDKALWQEKMISPTQALLLAKGDDKRLKKYEALIETPDKRPVVAPEGDRRKPWSGRPPEAMFADEDRED